MEAYTKVIKLLERQNLEILKLKQEKLNMTVNMEEKEESIKDLLMNILEGMKKRTSDEEEKKSDKLKSEIGSNSDNESSLKF